MSLCFLVIRHGGGRSGKYRSVVVPQVSHKSRIVRALKNGTASDGKKE